MVVHFSDIMKRSLETMKRTTPMRKRARRFVTDRYAYRAQPIIYLSRLLSESSCSPHSGRFFLGQRSGPLT
jgi:hypothetical protein